MNKQDYINAIENLNLELKKLYNNPEYKKYRDKILIKKLIKNGYYKMAYVTISNLFKNRMYKTFKFFKKAKKVKRNVVYNKINKKRGGKTVVYTCILNNYDTLYSPLIDTENTEYVVFSDNPSITSKTKLWKFREIPKHIKEICKNNSTLINRYIKMHPKELFSDFDFALYVDGSIRIISDISDLFYKINDKTGLAMHLHPKRSDIYEEAKACLKSSFGNKRNIKKLIKNYKKEGCPQKFGLFEAGIIAIDLNNKNSEIILNHWWEYFMESETFRDQLIFTYILWKLKYKFSDVGVLGDNISVNPKFVISVHNYNKIKKRKSS